MKWIKHSEQIPQMKDVYTCSDTMLLYFSKTNSFDLGFWWPIERAWCSSESVGPFRDSPTYWSDLKPFPNHDMGEWYDYWNFEPTDEEIKLIWEERNPEHINLAFFKNEKWYFDDACYGGTHEIKVVDEPGKLLWRVIPEFPEGK